MTWLWIVGGVVLLVLLLCEFALWCSNQRY